MVESEHPGARTDSSDGPPGESLSAWLFLRALGLIYLIAFVSLWVQIHGLIGSRGILPVESWLAWVAEQTGHERFWRLPTVLWLGADDRALHLWCGSGTALSLALLAGLAPAPVLALLWLLYLSLTSAGQVFLAFQWDNLLLECGFLAIFLTPLGLRPRRSDAPARLPLWLLRWLLFRLMFGSGVVKLASGDPTWRDLTALAYHYETQPLPAWTSWYLHQLPLSFHRFETVLMFVLELLVPLLIFAPARLRRAAAIALIGFQMLLIGSGNFAFFNWLTIGLCLLLLDDAAWPRRWRATGPTAGRPARRWPAAIQVSLAVLTLALTGAELVAQLRRAAIEPEPLRRLHGWLAPLRSFNAYGLFAVMTTRRPEIVIEGSDDGLTWQAYEFRWKPGDPARAPEFVAPHQPRLDWQMWFAALGELRASPWLVGLMERLLEGSPPVLALLERDPFAGRPPRLVRALLYDYRFTDAATRGRDRRWWRRELRGPYSPVLTLQGERLMATRLQAEP